MSRFIDNITLGELIKSKGLKLALYPTLRNKISNHKTYVDYMATLKVTQEMIRRHKDKKEKETGVFHWRDADGNYIPISELSDEELERASLLCQKKQCWLHEEICGWQYRLNQIEKEADRRKKDLPYYTPSWEKNGESNPPKFKPQNIKTADIVEDSPQYQNHDTPSHEPNSVN